MKKIVILISLILLFSFDNSFSNPFFIAPNGSDSNSGTHESPFRTIVGALHQVNSLRNNGKLEGDVEIVLRNGEYRIFEPLFLTNDLWDGNNKLIIRGEKDGVSVIKGSIKIKGFEKVSDRLWKLKIPEVSQFGKNNIQQLFVNGRRAIRARTPNNGEMFKTGKVEEIKLDSNNYLSGGKASQKIFLTESQFTALKPALHDKNGIIISINHAWDRTRGYIQDISLQDSTVFIINRQMPPYNTLNNSSQFFFENSKAFLDSPGEWYFADNGELFYMPHHGEDAKTAVVEIPVLDQLMVIQGNENKLLENIIFENLSFKHTRHIMPVEGESPNQSSSSYGAAIELNYVKNIAFNQCEIADVSNYAVSFKTQCSFSKMTSCYLHNLGMGGVRIGETRRAISESEVTNNIIIDNNIIRSGGLEIPTGVGVIIFHASDNTISHNDIADFRYSGVSVGWVWGYTPSVAKRNKIVYNHIHHLGWGELSDMGGVYTLGPSEGTVVNNNHIHDIYSYGYGGWGLYTDEGSTGIEMENNLVYNCKSAGFHQHYGKNNIIRNNIFAFNMISQLQATRIEEHLSFTFTNNIVYFDEGYLLGKDHGVNWHKVKMISDNNCYWDTRTKNILFEDISFKEWQKQGKDAHSLITDPGFVNPKQYDFKFKNKLVMRKIGFKPFDYNEAGVYGEADWKDKARLPQQIIDSYSETVRMKSEEFKQNHNL